MADNYPTFSRLDNSNKVEDNNLNVAQGQMNVQPISPESEPFNPNNPYGPKAQDVQINSSHMRTNVFNPSADVGLSCAINSDQMKTQKPMIPQTNNSSGAPPYNPSADVGLSCAVNSDQMKSNNFNKMPNQINNNMMPPNVISQKMNTPMPPVNMNQPNIYPKEKYNIHEMKGNSPIGSTPQVVHVPVPVPVFVPDPMNPYNMVPPFVDPMYPPEPFIDPIIGPIYPPPMMPPPPYDGFY